MPDFTPGPWVVDVWGLGIFSRSGDCSIVDLAEANSDKEKIANARLIAAAPDMYEATVSLWHILNFLLAIVPDELKKDLPEKIANVEKLLNRIHGEENN